MFGSRMEDAPPEMDQELPGSPGENIQVDSPAESRDIVKTENVPEKTKRNR